MGLLEEIPPGEKPGISRRALLLLAVGGFLGTVFGVVLAIVSIILPWNVLRQRARQRSSFLMTFDPASMVRSIPPRGVGWSSTESDLRRYNRGQQDERPWARTIRISGEGINPKDQAALASQLAALVRADPRSWYSGPTISTTTYRETVSPSSSRFFGQYTIGYQVGEVEGFVQIWAVGHGDDLELLVTIQEP